MDAREIARRAAAAAEKKKNPHPNDCAEWYPPPPPPGSAPPPPPPPNPWDRPAAANAPAAAPAAWEQPAPVRLDPDVAIPGFTPPPPAPPPGAPPPGPPEPPAPPRVENRMYAPRPEHLQQPAAPPGAAPPPFGYAPGAPPPSAEEAARRSAGAYGYGVPPGRAPPEAPRGEFDARGFRAPGGGHASQARASGDSSSGGAMGKPRGPGDGRARPAGWATRLNADGSFPPRFEIELNQMYSKCSSMADVFRIWNEYGALNGVNLATAFSRLGRSVAHDAVLIQRVRISYEFKDMLRLLRGKICDDATWAGPRQLANMAHALAKLDPAAARQDATVREELAALSTIARASSQRCHEFNTQELSNTAWAFATAGCVEPRLFEAIAKEAEQMARDFNPQELANTLWAFAKLGAKAPAMFEKLGDAAIHRAEAFTPQNISNTAWSFAKAGLAHARVFEVLAKVGAKKIPTFSVQALSNTAWAYATNRHLSEPEFFERLGDVAARKVPDFSPNALADTTWSFVTLEVPHVGLLNAVGDFLVRRADYFAPAALAKFAYAFRAADARKRPGTYELRDEHLRGLVDAALRFVCGHKPLRCRDGTELCQAYAALYLSFGSRCGRDAWLRLFEALDANLSRQVRDAGADELAAAAAAFADVGVEAKLYFQQMLVRVVDAKHFGATLVRPRTAAALLDASARLRWRHNQGSRALVDLGAATVAGLAPADAAVVLARTADLGGFHDARLFPAVVAAKLPFAGAAQVAAVLGAFAVAGAWFDDYLLALHATLAKDSVDALDAGGAANLRAFRSAAKSDRPALYDRLAGSDAWPAAPVSPPAKSRRGQLVADASAALAALGWDHVARDEALAGDGDRPETFADFLDVEHKAAALLCDASRLVRCPNTATTRPSGVALFAARLLMRGGWRVVFADPREIDAAARDAAAAAALLDRLRGVAAPPAADAPAADDAPTRRGSRGGKKRGKQAQLKRKRGTHVSGDGDDDGDDDGFDAPEPVDDAEPEPEPEPEPDAPDAKRPRIPKKSKPKPEPAAAPAPEPEPAAAPAPEPEPEPAAAPEPEPEPAAAPEPEPEPAAAPEPEPEPAAEEASLTKAEVSKMTVVQLREQLSRRDLETKGLKAALQKRLLAAI